MAKIGLLLIAALVLLQPFGGWAASAQPLRAAPMAAQAMPCCPHMHTAADARPDAPGKPAAGPTSGSGCCQHWDCSFVLAPPVAEAAAQTGIRSASPRVDLAVAFDSHASGSLFRPPRA